MRTFNLTAIMLAALLATNAANADVRALQGKWKISAPSNPMAGGIAFIDAEGRVTVDSIGKEGKATKLRGIARSEGHQVNVTLTDGASVRSLSCVPESSDLLRCRTVLQANTLGEPILLTRIDGGYTNIGPQAPTRAAFKKESLIGTWSIPHSTLAAIVVIDRSYRATMLASLRGAKEPGEMGQEGSVVFAFPKVEISFTRRLGAWNNLLNRYFCTVQSSTEMDCANHPDGGKASPHFIVTRIGDID